MLMANLSCSLICGIVFHLTIIHCCCDTLYTNKFSCLFSSAGFIFIVFLYLLHMIILFLFVLGRIMPSSKRWVNSPPCHDCGNKTVDQGMADALPSETLYGAFRVELHRYGHKILIFLVQSSCHATSLITKLKCLNYLVTCWMN